MPRKNVEDAIQREFIRWARAEYPDIAVVGTRNEDSYRRSEEIEAGLPDILGRFAIGDVRHFIYFEIKTQKGRLQKVQIAWGNKPRCLNEHYDVGYGLADCREKWAALVESARINIIV